MTTAILCTILQSHSLNPVQTAQTFLNSLSPTLKTQTLQPFNQDRTAWNYIPLNRKGAHLADLNPDQTQIAQNLLTASLSELGYNRVKNIETLEGVLREIENNPSRDPGQYTFTFFGQPDSAKPWAWRFEGHHLSLNFTYQGNKLVSSTPQFFGSNPATVPSGTHKGLRPLASEEDLAYAFLKTLTPDQLKTAVTNPQAPADILTSNTRKAIIQSFEGISIKDLSKPQRQALLSLLHTHAESQSAQESKRRLQAIDQDSIVFAWMGETTPNKPHYYRIHGNSFIVELDNTQNNANHVHTVWRDFKDDFGQDALADHYQKQHNSR